MSWMAWSTALAALVGLGVCFHEWAVGEDDWRAGQKTLAKVGAWVLGSTWFVFVPLSFFLWRTGSSAAWLFGAETYDGGVVEAITTIGLIASVLLAARQAIYSESLIRTGFWTGIALIGVLAFGEEASWGQHLFHWSSTGAFASGNLQGETNLHNFVSPRIYDVAYAIVGWGLVLAAGLLSLRPGLMGSILRYAPFGHASPVGVALVVTSGVLLQHEVFEELAEALTILALVFVQLQLALTARAGLGNPDSRLSGVSA